MAADLRHGCQHDHNVLQWLDPDTLAPWGLVDVDWFNQRQFWIQTQPMDCEERLVTQAVKLRQRV